MSQRSDNGIQEKQNIPDCIICTVAGSRIRRILVQELLWCVLPQVMPLWTSCGVAINSLVDLKHSFVDIGSLNIHLLILDEPENRKTEALKMDVNVDRPKQQQI